MPSRLKKSRQSQVAESIQNLAKSNGGTSDEEVDRMMEHISPKPEIPSSFKDLVSSDTKSQRMWPQFQELMTITCF